MLVIDEDPQTVGVVRRTLIGDGHDVRVSTGGDLAHKLLVEGGVDVLLLDDETSQAEVPSLLDRALGASRPVPTVMILSRATARDAERALDRGATGVLDKPFSAEELRRSVARAVEGESFRGHLKGLAVLDLFQVFNLSRRSLVAVLGTQPEARVWFEKGEVIHAEQGGLEGEAVLDTLLEVRNGGIRTLPFSPSRRSIHRAFHNLLLDLLRTRDESSQDIDATLDVGERDFLGLSPELLHPDLPIEEPSEVGDISTDAVTALPSRRFDPICVAITAEIPEAIAVALIELSSGALLGLSNSASFTPEFERFVALYTRSFFRGPEVRHIEDTLAELRGVDDTGAFVEEVVVSSKHTHHLTKVLAGGEVALMVVTPRRAPPDQTWRHIRGMLPVIERNLG